jgi:regulatory protein
MSKDVEEVISLVYLKMLNFLSYRSRSESELSRRFETYTKKEKLEAEDYEKVRVGVFDRLEEEGFINDDRFTEGIVGDFKRSKTPVSKMQIKKKLFMRGIPKEIAEKHLDTFSEEHELEAALELFDKKISYLKDPLRGKRKMFEYLFRRGFNSGVINRVFDIRSKKI